jgi:hypothetical protein
MPAAKTGGKKRGRKPKNQKISKDENVAKHKPKKRGRKPKGGKIVKNILDGENKEILKKSNIILHLKCSTNDIEKVNNNVLEYDPSVFNIQNKTHNIKFNELNKETDAPADKKDTWDKIKILKKRLHFNDVADKRCNCFWCTCPFDNPPIYIPKQERNGLIEVYGCFCSPECAVAYLKKEPIDTSTLWERYSLLNNIYSDIYNYEENIKPAPDPYYLLDKFYGNLSIQEYRKLLNNQQLLLVVEKPLTKILPELFEENNDMPSIYSNLLTDKQNKNNLRLHRKLPKSSKKNILTSNFNLS